MAIVLDLYSRRVVGWSMQSSMTAQLGWMHLPSEARTQWHGEAFVKTFKQDYVYVHDLPDAKTVMAQLDQWLEDYNEYHPHKGLKMKVAKTIHPQPITNRILSGLIGATPVATLRYIGKTRYCRHH